MGHVCISIFVGLSGRGEVGGGRSGWEGSVGGEGKKYDEDLEVNEGEEEKEVEKE